MRATSNSQKIHHWYCLGGFQEELWERFFMEHGISPHFVIYEELVADYESTVRRVLVFFGVEGEQTFIPPRRTQKQSDGVSEEWEERYRKLSEYELSLGTVWAIRKAV